MSLLVELGINGLQSYEVTDILNIQQLVTIDGVTKFLNVTDVLQHSVYPSHNADAVFNCLINAFGKKNLKLGILKELVIYEASVIAENHNGVAAKFKKLADSTTMTNMHYIYHRLVFACADASDDLKFMQKLRILYDLWAFFSKPHKSLKSYY